MTGTTGLGATRTAGMLGQGAAVAPNQGSFRGTRWALRVGLGIQAAMGVSQPILAGSYLSGNLDAISLHSTIGGSLTPVTFVVLVLALAHRWPGGGPTWPAAAMSALVVLVVVQANAGYSRTLGLHIPLGVSIVGSMVALFVWSVVGGRARRRPSAPDPDPS